MHDVLWKQNEPEDDLDKKSGLLPRIKKLSGKQHASALSQQKRFEISNGPEIFPPN